MKYMNPVILALVALLAALSIAFLSADNLLRGHSRVVPYLYGVCVALLLFAAVNAFLIARKESKLKPPLPRSSPLAPAEDVGTLKSRVIQLRNDLQAFLNEIGDRPKTEREPGMTAAEYDTARLNEALLWNDKLTHGFALRFTERAQRIFHECGQAGTTHTMFGIRIANDNLQKSDIVEIIDDLTWLARNVD
jgi:hypothetical protein